jgi:carboxymethylenebutenolidase
MASYSHWAIIDTADGPMSMYVAVPGGGDPRPAVLIIHGIDGLATGTTAVADRFAEEGYVAAAPDLFHRGPIPSSFEDLYKRRRGHTDAQTSLDIAAAIAHLQVQPLVKPGPVGIIGFCMGGRVAYYIAGTNPSIGVAADCYGGGLFVSEGGLAPIEYTNNIRCPIILLDGELDRNPSPQDLETIQAELKKHGVTYEAHIYPGVGHGFMGEEPSDTSPEASDEAWKQVWAWFHRHLETAPNTYVQTRIPAPQR